MNATLLLCLFLQYAITGRRNIAFSTEMVRNSELIEI